ncbi:MAG: hypothetical protein HN432_12370 [Gammaproteobacteria bacterium]|nr:hypothetical protein [Gammaproteobacteria bacterium]
MGRLSTQLPAGWLVSGRIRQKDYYCGMIQSHESEFLAGEPRFCQRLSRLQVDRASSQWKDVPKQLHQEMKPLLDQKQTDHR